MQSESLIVDVWANVQAYNLQFVELSSVLFYHHCQLYCLIDKLEQVFMYYNRGKDL